MNWRSRRLSTGASIPRWMLLIVLGGLAAAAILLAMNWRAKLGAKRWNVLLITLDTTRADRLGCYGSRNETPAIDSLARRGVLFANCYTPVPLTLPSHCSLMTGLVPLRHQVHDNGPDRLHSNADTLAEILSRYGYTTAAFIGAFVLDRQFGLDQGFDHYDDQMTAGSGNAVRYAERNAARVTDSALDWLDRSPRQPLFLWVHYFDPHAPYAPPEYDPKFAAHLPYDAEIVYVDRQLKRLLEAVNKRLGSDTLIILAADHGESLGEHGDPTHGVFAYNATLRVPLIVSFPDGRHGNQVVKSPVSLVDVMPSVLDWLGIESPAQLDGLRLALGQRSPDSDDSRAVYFENQCSLNNYGWAALDGIVVGNHKLIRAPRPELYDLQADPREQTNLLDADADRSRQFMAQLEGVVAELQGRPALASQPAEVSSDDVARLRSLGYAGDRASTAPASPSLPDPKDMIDVYNQIQDICILLEQRQVTRATEMLLEILESKDPANRRALRLAAAMSLDEPGLRDRVIACLKRAVIESDNPSTDAFVVGKLGVTLMEDRRVSEAADVFSRLVQLNPQSAIGCRYLADCHRQLGNSAEAARWYDRALDMVQGLEEVPDWAAKVSQQRAQLPTH